MKGIDCMSLYKEWLIKAKRDLESAKKLMEGENPLADTAIYHTQQCAEKSLKAYLIYKNENLLKTHNLRLLVEECIDINNEFIQLLEPAVSLTPFSTMFRYPGPVEIPDNEDVTEAIDRAELIYEFVIDQIS